MLEDIDPGMVALFGSQNRTLVLSALANASGPLSGYRVAKLFGGQKIKVNAELVRLAKAGIVTRRRAPSGELGWTLEDPDLRRLLRKRARICFAPDWDRRRPASGEAVNRILAEIEASLPDPKVDREFYRPKNWKPTPAALNLLREKVRPPEKDAILRKYGARTSYREGERL
jgi:hypothetical protein